MRHYCHACMHARTHIHTHTHYVYMLVVLLSFTGAPLLMLTYVGLARENDLLSGPHFWLGAVGTARILRKVCISIITNSYVWIK